MVTTVAKEILEPSQRDEFNYLTKMEMATACTFKNSMKEQRMFSANIGLLSPLICRCRQWPAYITLMSPTVKMLVEQDKLRKAGSQGTSEECRQGMGSSRSSRGHTPGRKPSVESQEAGFTGTTEESSRPNEDSSPLRIARGSPANTEGLFLQSNSFSAGPPIKGNKVIFSSKPHFRVLPYGSQMSPSKQKSTACS
ncbi:CMT1A duplicated region transcript 4 protein homolog [Dermochelys coriacea]|uniref:CMT1A duplicated region transcript 4 protein homolog n=1 Tax=Dermochelys coriacea TaxID=27794 RepID=UPI001CA96303|nr:CMT1A duplicated region transcript 4 protein homolog [Dermochelys coriacea]